MKRREEWRPILDQEFQRWSAKSYERLVADLTESQVYEVRFQDKDYQVEVEIVQRTGEYIMVAVSVDDGTLPASLRPLFASFVREKPCPPSRTDVS